jgi:class 3 adenylate cyclase
MLEAVRRWLPRRDAADRRDNRSRRLSVRSKFLLMMLLTSLLSLGTITWLAYQAGKKALTEAAVNQLTSLRAAKKQQVEHYFASMRDSFRVVADAPLIAKAIEELTEAYYKLGQLPLTPERMKGLESYYETEFLPRLARNSDARMSLDELLPRNPTVRELQALYISENPNKVGEKSKLTRHKIEHAYTLAHETYHPWFKQLASELKFYDAFLIDADSGNIVYSVAKETDLGQNLFQGPIAGTHLAQLVREVIRTRRKSEVRLADFGFYLPSYNEPAAFIASPVFRDQRLVGVLAAQVSTEALSRFMHDGGKWREQGLGESGAVYLVGADQLMRSDTREIIEIPEKYVAQIKAAGSVPPAVADRIARQRTTVLHYPIRNAPVRQALLGRSGTDLIVNRRGFGAYMSYAPLDIPGLNWVIVARMDENEVLAAQVRFNRNVLIAACALALLATLAALWLARVLLGPMSALLSGIERLRAGDRNVVVASRTRDEFDDLVVAFNGMARSIKERDEVIEGKSRAHEQLLRRIFPEAVAERMKQGDISTVENFAQATVVYVIIDGFAALAESEHGGGASKVLNEIVDRFDTVAEDQGVEKVKTIGDHYLAASGLSVARLDHARRAIEFARRAARELALVNQAHGLALGLRIGMATGPVHAGLVGSRRFVFDIWGLAPSTARHIVYEADLNAVRINAEAHALISDRSEIGEELVVKTKTLGPITTYQLRLVPAQAIKAAE